MLVSILSTAKPLDVVNKSSSIFFQWIFLVPSPLSHSYVFLSDSFFFCLQILYKNVKSKPAVTFISWQSICYLTAPSCPL